MLNKGVLLIDDDEDDQEIFVSAIENLNRPVNCMVLDSAIDALEKLRAGHINPNLIFLDLNMPLMNGWQFLQEIKKEDDLKEIPVIILSTSSHTSSIRQAKEMGAVQFFSKPDKFEDLTALLNSVIQ